MPFNNITPLFLPTHTMQEPYPISGWVSVFNIPVGVFSSLSSMIEFADTVHLVYLDQFGQSRMMIINFKIENNK